MKQPTTAAISFAIAAALALTACSRKPVAPEQAAQHSPAPVQTNQTAEGIFSIGELSAVVLRDGGLDFPNDNAVFGIGHTPEEIAQVLGAAGQPTDKLSLSIQPLLVKAPERVLLFDTGAGTNFGPGAGALGKSLSEAGIDPGSITDIFISHAHGDHIGGLVNAEGGLAFGNATIHICAPEWAFLKGLNDESAARFGVSRHSTLLAAITPKVVAFEPGAELVPGVVKAVEIRGHTPGHSGYLIGSGEGSVLYIGDTMHHYIVSVQKPDWTIAFDGDAPTAQASRNEVLAQSAVNGQRVYAVHFPFPAIGKFEKRGDSYAWIPE